MGIGFFEVVALAIIASFFTKWFSIWTQSRQGNPGNAKIQALERRIQELEAHQNVKAIEERVHTLEEIVVSNEFELKKKLHELDS